MNLTQDKCAFNIIYSFDADHNIDGQPINIFRKRLAYALAEQVKNSGVKIDYVIPIPNTGIGYAKHVSKILNAKYLNPFVKKKVARTLGMTTGQRLDFYDRFLEHMKLPEGLSKVLFVDEALISGTTAIAISDWAKNKKIEEFSFGFASPPMINYCPSQMIKFAPRIFDLADEFSPLELKISEFKSLIGSDDIYFVPSQIFEEIVLSDRRCTLCFSKYYAYQLK